MSFLKKKSLRSSLTIIGALVQACVIRGGFHCQRLNDLWVKKDYLGIMEYEINYSDPSADGNDILYARQIMGFLQKQDFLDLGVDKEAVAFAKFIASERKCRITNHRFRTGARPENGRVDEVLYLAQRKIASILGDVPEISELKFKFGPGTNTSTKMGRACPRAKLSSNLECNANMVPVVGEFLQEFPLWAALHNNEVTVTPGKLAFVPKNALTDRTIIIEPILTGLYQKGIGSYLKQRLRKSGLDLSDQIRNQEFARIGSESDEIATVDLVSASDMISYGLVLDLIPMPWFEVFETGRTGEVTYKDQRIVLEKFSSMGNGFTFELESLIFFSLAHAVCTVLRLGHDRVRSYGDDIIIPVAGYSLLCDVLNYCGFEVNLKKSFSSGPFRESCGADYFRGIDIRPFYLKEQIAERTLYIMHNWFIRHCEFALAALVRSFVRHDLSLYGPDGYGDGHLIGDHVLRSNRKMKRNGYGGGFFDTYTLNPKRYTVPEKGDWIFPCYSVYVRSGLESPTDENIIRGTKGYSKISIYTLSTGIFNKPCKAFDIEGLTFGNAGEVSSADLTVA